MPITLGNTTIAGLAAGGLPNSTVNLSNLNVSGTAGSGNFLRGDGTWNAIHTSLSLGGSGWMRLNNGFMIQWGITQFVADFARVTQSFPTSFNSAAYSCVLTNVDSEDGNWQDEKRVYDLTTTGFTLFRRGNNTRFWFIATGS
jgi:hypothetical protein